MASTSTPGRQDDAPAPGAFRHALGADLRQRRRRPPIVAGHLELDEAPVRPPLFLEVAVMDDHAVLHDHRLVAHLLDVAQQVGADEHVHPLLLFISATSLSMRRRAAGSSPLVGSSSTTSSGPCTIAWASFAICFIPSE
jgi:hypothetical protein